MNSITVAANATINLNANAQVVGEMYLSADCTFNWISGVIVSGTINNYGAINIVSVSGVAVQGNVIINNYSVINFPLVNGMMSASLSVNDGTLNNFESGLIDMQGDGSCLTLQTGPLHDLNNYGTIKKSGGTNLNECSLKLHNFPAGVISIESGTFRFANAENTLEGGIYNVSSGCNLRWYTNNLYIGTLSGTLNGTFTIEASTSVTTEATFDFEGSSYIDWAAGVLNGGGVLINNHDMRVSAPSAVAIEGNTTLNNNGLIFFNTISGINVNDGILNNQLTGIIDFQVDLANISLATGPLHQLNNYGMIKKSGGTAVSSIGLDLMNMGIIEAMSGNFNISVLNNTTTGIIRGTASIKFPYSNYVNNGTIAPVASPGVLTMVETNYVSTASSVLDIEVNGTTQGTEYDLLSINGDANFNGTLHLSLGFTTAETDVFTVATTTGTITNCTINSIVTAVHENILYSYNVNCVNNNSLVLNFLSAVNVENIHDGFAAMTEVFPNPTNGHITVKTSNGNRISGIDVLNFNGDLIRSARDGNSPQQIVSLEDLSAGIYFIRTSLSIGDISYKKVVKE